MRSIALILWATTLACASRPPTRVTTPEPARVVIRETKRTAPPPEAVEPEVRVGDTAAPTHPRWLVQPWEAYGPAFEPLPSDLESALSFFEARLDGVERNRLLKDPEGFQLLVRWFNGRWMNEGDLAPRLVRDGLRNDDDMTNFLATMLVRRFKGEPLREADEIKRLARASDARWPNEHSRCPKHGSLLRLADDGVGVMGRCASGEFWNYVRGRGWVQGDSKTPKRFVGADVECSYVRTDRYPVDGLAH